MFSFNHSISILISTPISIPITYYIIQSENIVNIINSEIICYSKLYIDEATKYYETIYLALNIIDKTITIQNFFQNFYQTRW